jgi:hypothetical protein
MTDTEKLAAAFAKELREELGLEKIHEVNVLNAAEPGGLEQDRVDHAHDFCDANMVMDAAFTKTFGRETFSGDGAVNGMEDMELINAAWSVAKRAGYAL